MAILTNVEYFGYHFKQPIEPDNPRQNMIWLDTSGPSEWYYKAYDGVSWSTFRTITL